MRPAALLQLWFGLSLHVDRRAYFLSGAGLMLLKYSVDCAGMAIVTGRFWAPLAYLSPALFAREASLGDPPSWILWLLGLWTIPFLWIGASMSIRRAVDAGLSPWVGCLFFAPFVNYLMMLTLCLLPSAQQEGWRDADSWPGAALRGASRSPCRPP